MLEVCPIQTGNNQVLTYGPVYFLLTSLFSFVLGWGLYSIRLVNLLFAIISVIIFYKLARKIGLSSKLTIIFVSLLSFDTIFVQNAHSGRMDLVALCFFLLAINFHLNIKNKLKSATLLSVLGTLAVLTTLRIAILVLPAFALLWFKYIYDKEWRSVIVLPVLSIVLYLIWVFVGFGSIEAFILHYTNTSAETGKSLTNSFIGSSLYVPFYQLPLVITGIVAVLFLLYKKVKSVEVWTYILPIVFFYSYVKDTGAYSAMVVPFWYLVIALSIKEFQNISLKKSILNPIIYTITLGLLFVNVGVFVTKSVTILLSLNERNPKPLSVWVENNLPKGCNVVGDDRYYYVSMKNDCDFQYIDRVNSPSDRAKFHFDNFKPDYLFVSNQTPKENINAYLEYYSFTDTLNYSIPNKSVIASKILNFIPIPISSSYEGSLIKLELKEDVKLLLEN